MRGWAVHFLGYTIDILAITIWYENKDLFSNSWAYIGDTSCS